MGSSTCMRRVCISLSDIRHHSISSLNGLPTEQIEPCAAGSPAGIIVIAQATFFLCELRQDLGPQREKSACDICLLK